MGTFAGSRRIAARPQRMPRLASARRRGMVLIGAVVLVAALAGMLLGRVLS